AQVPIVRGKDGTDPGAVLFDAVTRARGEKLDVVLCDTAGRLHTKPNLMEELKRLKRTLSKAQEGAPHEVLLVVDATTGQNAIQQARQFHDSLGVTGFVLTKLDGTAKGGVIIGIRAEPVDVVLTDLMMPAMSGQELLRAVRAVAPDAEVVLMTAYGTVDAAVAAMKDGAYDFLTKPLKRHAVLKSVQQAIEKRRLVQENKQLRARLAGAEQPIVGQSPSL